MEFVAFVRGMETRDLRICRRVLSLFFAVSAIFTALTGYILSLEGHKTGLTLQRHQWSGVAVGALSVLFLFLLIIEKRSGTSRGAIRRVLRRLILFCLLPLIAITGHLGGELTHGSDFLFARFPNFLQALQTPTPSSSKSVTVASSDTVYDTLIQPILDNHCVTCHGTINQYGNFAAHTYEALMSGGLLGPAIVPGNPLRGELLRRVQLPTDHYAHMPPASETQLTPQHIAALKWWIGQGASATKPLKGDDVPPDLRDLLVQMKTETGLLTAIEPTTNLDVAVMRRLRNKQISIQRIQRDSDLLWVSFSAITGQVTDETLPILSPVAHLIAWMDLSHTRITGNALSYVAQMSELKELNLRQTTVDTESLKQLANLGKLEKLNLGQTDINDDVVDTLLALPNLKVVYLRGTRVGAGGIARLNLRRIRVLLAENPTEEIAAPPTNIAADVNVPGRTY